MSRIHNGNSYTIQLRFLQDNRKSANALHLYCYLRRYSIDRAGYVPKDIMASLSRNQKERLIPFLLKKGWAVWVKDVLKLKSSERILAEMNPGETANSICVKLDYDYLISVKKLKEFIFSSVEAYILKGKYISETKGHLEVDRDTKRFVRQPIKREDNSGHQTIRLSKNGSLSKEKAVSDLLSSKISHQMLSSWGYSSKEVSRLRKSGINTYKREFSNKVDKYGNDCFFSKKNKIFVKCLPTTVTCSYSSTFFFNSNLKRTDWGHTPLKSDLSFKS